MFWHCTSLFMRDTLAIQCMVNSGQCSPFMLHATCELPVHAQPRCTLLAASHSVVPGAGVTRTTSPLPLPISRQVNVTAAYTRGLTGNHGGWSQMQSLVADVWWK